MEINRTFTHRTFGEIGSAALVANVTDVTLDGKVLPEASVEYLLHFALQSLQDAYAGAKTDAEAKAAWEKKRDALLAGTVGVRGGGDGVTEEVRVQRMITRNMFKAKVGGKSPEWATFTGLSDDEQNAKLDAWYEANAKALGTAVEEELKRREAARKAKAKLAGAVEFAL